MQSFSFIPNETYYDEAQALYIGLLGGNAQPSDSAGLTYWENVLATNPGAALNALSSYVTYDGQPLTTSNIDSEIVNIYHNLLGETVSSSSSGVQYWASQWTGNGGTLSAGMILYDFYAAAQSAPSTNLNNEIMNNKILYYYNEAQALYLGLLNNNSPSASGLTYWENVLATNPGAALNAISSYVTYDGQPLTTSNIDSEIVSLYHNLLGETVSSSSSGVKYWASQWTGNGGTLSIGMILYDLYAAVENSPSANGSYATMTNNITNDNINTSFSATLADINYSSSAQSYTMPTTFQVPVTNPYYDSNGNYITTSYQYSYIFPASATQSDTLVLPASSNNLTITDVNNNTYYGTMSYAFTGDASGHNTVDVSYQASGGSGLTSYLADATNFQTLDFNYNGTNNNYNSVNLNLNLINSGFVNFVMDNSGFDNFFTFSNAVNNDTFIVQATVSSLNVSDSTGNTNLNLIMNGNVSIGSNSNSALTFNGQTVNIDSTGQLGNLISGIDFYNNALITSMTLNISGSESLTIGAHPSSYSTYGIFLNDGSTLNVNDNSNGLLTIYAGDNSNSSNPTGITLNFSGSSAPLTIYDISQHNTPDNIILGSGADTVYTDNGNSIITAGSGQDTITVDTAITANYSYSNGVDIYTSYSGYTPGIKNAGSNDSITFSDVNSAHPIQFESTQLNETSATSLNNAMLNAMNDAYSLFSANVGGDFAVWFEYGNNTYIVNDSNLAGGGYANYSNFQIVELTGTVNLSNATSSVSTIHI